jgi:uncharacterized protein
MLTHHEQQVLAETEAYVQATLAQDATGHDWHHVFRVRQLAVRIATDEGANLYCVALTALLHDIADWKFHHGDDTAGPRKAQQWLARCEVPQPIVDDVVASIAGLSFRGAEVPPEPLSLEGMCVQDADRLDALGAIGIGRAFAYGGYKGRPLYDPQVPPELHTTYAAYKKNAGPTLNHFYEKLLLLRDRMNTATGRRLAAERHAYIEAFVTRFLAEWRGEV